MTIHAGLQKCISLLKQKKFIDCPGREATILICDLLKIEEKEFICLKDSRLITAWQNFLLMKKIKKRMAGKSIAQLTGKKHFYDIELMINKHVLVPRPETEVLVETVIKQINPGCFYQTLEVGIGSGAIAVTLARHFPALKIDGIDKSRAALKLAQKNRQKYRIPASQLNLIRADFFKFVPLHPYDIIMSNPPYIPGQECRQLRQKKIVADPMPALDGGPDGLKFYYHLKSFAQKYLNPQGIMVIEHGAGQQEKIRCLFEKETYLIQSYQDLAGLDRILYIKKKY